MGEGQKKKTKSNSKPSNKPKNSQKPPKKEKSKKASKGSKASNANGIDQSSCEAMHKETNDVWLLGETMSESPFSAQLLAVYSYVPVSFAFDANLIITDLWAHEYKIEKGEIRGTNMIKKAFSSFFDYNRFVTYWSRHGKKIISLNAYKSCFRNSNDTIHDTLQLSSNRKKKLSKKKLLELNSRYYHSITTIHRIPEFYPYTREDFYKFFTYANLSTESQFTLPFTPHQQLRIESRYKMTGLYSFWNDSTMLSSVYSALQPAVPIEKVSHAIIEILPKPTIAIHIRMDNEAFYDIWIKLQSNEDLYQKLIEMILESSCFHEYVKVHKNNNHTTYEIIKQPMLYISMNFQPDLKGAQVRKQRIIQSFLNIGFYGIYNNDRMYYLFLEQQRKIKEGQHPEKSELNDHITSLSLMQSLSPEQLSYVDMIVSRSSACFVPSVVPSLHSYMTARMRSLDGKVFEKYEDINVSSYGPMYFYRDWGF
eukprot:gene9309-10109_t